jgi:hypothetical protein
MSEKYCGLIFGYTVINVNEYEERTCILIYKCIQQAATLHSLFYLETALHGTITHYQECKQLYLQHLVPAAIAADSSNGVTNTRCCRYSCLRS